MNLTTNTILITGGAAGIGFALARQLCERGNRVIICGRSEEALLKAQAKVPALITRICNITDAASRQAMVDWLNTAYPDLNVMVNNAGVQYRRMFKEGGALEHLEQEVATNFTAPVQLIGALLPLLIRQPKAVIVNVSSGLAFAPMADIPVYCATKAAMHSFTLTLRHQLKATGVRVVEMAPPIVDTGLGGGDRSGGTTDQHMMTPEDFATQALAQLENDQDEVMVGLAAGARKMGEALFERMNGT
ncbi:SDR family NAD(P)-dependent oxidoreductase [Rhodoferax sp. AJA081-3]|uniref:SDR family oxidoreductase n=1 Tax=Rhodoferax sp. AJA081-3 TaxID=2752316 RepID=UPI001AE05675|nr:SDR family NAD(P)-dependent oxidoreductase [Rhodoferax sp. AJA081-3]QTN30033.1 SDR family NAD(P)-dependent oxidoreductase [Rhodoferax sp. AJA081-3]